MSKSDSNASVMKIAQLDQASTTVPRMVEYLFDLAVRAGASDIHMGINNVPGDKQRYLLRLRIAGRLRVVKSQFMNSHYDEVVQRVKILAGMNTTNIGVPQDGQITLERKGGEDVTLRVAIIPNQGAEEVCIRIQRNERLITMDQLLMTEKMFNNVQDLIRRENGMIILNGPAGSGKTTTILSFLHELAGPDKKILTAEDPIERRLPFVNHVQVTEKAGYAELSRTYMRHDADIIFIGEIRDSESAITAVQLAQTGHLVLTTLHTRDSIGVIARMKAFDIHPNFIADTLVGSLAQRLVLGLCHNCKVEYKPDERIVRNVGKILPPPDGVKFYKEGAGCDQCTQVVNGEVIMKGSSGLVPIFELLIVDAEIQEAINREISRIEIREIARKRGMTTLAEEALLRVYQGYIDVNSVYGSLFSMRD